MANFFNLFSSASEGDSKKSNGFQHQSSIQRAFMPKEEMKLYTSVNWSYKNVHLPKNTDLNNTFESFNLSRKNYIGTD